MIVPTLEPIDYDDGQHRNYHQGRPLSGEAEALWMGAFAQAAPVRRPLSVIDLGSGTGRFSPPLARGFGGPVFGVEPSRKMREVAARENGHPAVTYLAGSAEAIPLADSAADLVVMVLSIQHVRDRLAGGREIARVLKADGRLLVRSVFSDRMPDIGWHAFFPRAREIEMAMFPTTSEVEAMFAPHGLRRLDLITVREPMAASLSEEAERLKLRAISTFEHLTEDEIAEGFDRLEAAVAGDVQPVARFNDSDLMVLGRAQV